MASLTQRPAGVGLDGAVQGVAQAIRTLEAGFLAGASTGQMQTEGNIVVQTVSAGKNPSATGADKVVATAQLPANLFDVAGRGVNIMACGSMSAAATAKTLKIIINPTVTAIDGTVTDGTTIASFSDATANSGGGWQLAANIFKFGAAGSNTQISLHESGQAKTVVGALVAPSLLTATESGVINVVVTANATTATTDITFNFLQINMMN